MSERLVAAVDELARGAWHSRPLPFGVYVSEAVALLAHETMVYQCDRCLFEWRVWLTLGVEGPSSLRDARLYVACPFVAGRCPAWPNMKTCDGKLSHVRWSEDERFEPRMVPDDAPRFVVDRGLDCARLVIPEPALVYARRYHNE